MFARYAAIVKNLRGVALFDLDEEGVWDSVQWLVKRFRYRDIGLPPSVVERYRDKLSRYLGGNPFRELVYPVPNIDRLTNAISRVLNIDRQIVEALVFASIYISPMLLVGKKYLDTIVREAVEVVYACKDMDTNSWKLHLRIADYTILDFYEQCVEESMQILEKLNRGEPVDIEKVVADRRTRISRDVQRYWRIKCSSGRVFLAYIDMLKMFSYTYKLIGKLIGDLDLNWSAALAIVPVVFIPPGMK